MANNINNNEMSKSLENTFYAYGTYKIYSKIPHVEEEKKTAISNSL